MSFPDTILRVEGVSKQYRLGMIGTGTLSHDLNRWWYKVRGKEDPYLKIGERNDRSKEGGKYVWALQDIDLEVKQGEVVGVIGKNGAGKSTLLKILSRITGPTTGNIRMKGRLSSLLEVGTGFHPELTGRENIYLNGAILGMTKMEISSKFDEIVAFSGCAKYVDTPVKRYSSGMMVRLGFSIAAHLEPEILIVDEVLAVGDADFQKRCILKMKEVSEQGRTILFVSHNMMSVKNLCPRSILLDQGRKVMDGDTDEIINYYLKGDAQEQSGFGKVSDDIRRNKYLKDYLNIESISCFNSNNEFTDQVRYHEPIEFHIEIFCEKPVEDVVFALHFMDETTDKISYSGSNDLDQNKVYNIKQGTNQVVVRVDQQLIPGEYSIGFSVMNKEGYPYDAISYFGKMNVLNYGLYNEKYFWMRPLGLVNFKSNFQLNVNESINE